MLRKDGLLSLGQKLAVGFIADRFEGGHPLLLAGLLCWLAANRRQSLPDGVSCAACFVGLRVVMYSRS